MSRRWTVGDIVRTATDFTPSRGVLEPMDDIVPLSEAQTPYVTLLRSAASRQIRVWDFRQYPRQKGSRGRAHGTRLLKDVTAIWWHQTAVPIDSALRCLNIPVHGAVTKLGAIVLLHPMLAYMYHGNAANRFTIGIEVCVRAAGIHGLSATYWRSRREKKADVTYEDTVFEMTDTQRISAILLGEYYIQEHRRQCALPQPAGQPPGIVAQGFHRNSSRSRTSDPGSRVALEVVRPLCRRHHIQYGHPVVGSGVPTPTTWGGEKNIPYSRNVRGYD